jgi:hypothetical protein
MIHLRSCFVLSVLILSACAHLEPAKVSKSPVVIPKKDADVYEAVFRHQFSRNASGAQQRAVTYFIEIQDADPSSAFIARFSDVDHKVKVASKAYYGRGASVTDRSNHSQALLFRVDGIKWLDSNTAEVTGGYYEGDLSSSGNIYRVQRTRSGWKVTNDVMEWIS